MKNRKSIIFFLFWSLVFSAVLFILSFMGKHDVKTSGGSLSSLDVGKITRIDICRRVEADCDENLLMVRSSGKWLLESPVKAEADDESVRRMLETLVFAELGDSLSRSDMAALGRSLRDFGLASPGCTVMISAGDAKETFMIGRKTAAGDEVYATRDDSASVFTVPVRVMDEVMRPSVDFRRRRLFTFDSSDVMGFGLKDPGQPLIRVGKYDGQWRIVDPVESPADRQMAEDLVTALCSAQVLEYVPEAATGRGLGDDEGFTVSLRDTFGSVERVVFGSADGSGDAWALTSEGAVVRVNREVLDNCRSKLKMLEDTRLFPVDASQVYSFSVSRGYPAFVVSRDGPSAQWRLVSPVDVSADAKSVEKLLSDILSLKSAELLKEGAEDAVLVSVGTSVTNFNAQYVSAKSLMNGGKLVDLLDKTVLCCSHQRVKRIQIKTAAGDQWNAENSDSLLSLLEDGIVAERMDCAVLSPEDFERCGFNHPSHTVSFEFKDGGSSMKRMLIGSVAPDGGRYAMIGGLDAAFVLSSSTISVITKPVDVLKEEAR